MHPSSFLTYCPHGCAQISQTLANPLMTGLSDPDVQKHFNKEVSNALDPSFIFPSDKEITVEVKIGTTDTGLVDGSGNLLQPTPIYGYSSP